ncbi:MAG: tryptophan synthase subunit alpha [Deltaproteobacteria bacterium]|nr:tryptophan synthase subunit alpha [Deltaproteobacteria bacterium]
MKRLRDVFSERRKPLVIFLTAGFPGPGRDEELAHAVLDAGADIIELGFPFSDPLADGPLIQKASGMALAAGMTLKKTMDLAGRLRRENAGVPIILMGYANPVYHMGYRDFAGRAKEMGVDGAIIPDLPLEEGRPLRNELAAGKMALIPMAAPNTPSGRLTEILRNGSGFLYLVSMAGLTGDVFQADAPWRQSASTARESGALPVCVGFGIRNGQDAARAAESADGVIVGSAVTARILDAPDDKSAVRNVVNLVRELRAGMDSAT